MTKSARNRILLLLLPITLWACEGVKTTAQNPGGSDQKVPPPLQRSDTQKPEPQPTPSNNLENSSADEGNQAKDSESPKTQNPLRIDGDGSQLQTSSSRPTVTTETPVKSFLLLSPNENSFKWQKIDENNLESTYPKFWEGFSEDNLLTVYFPKMKQCESALNLRKSKKVGATQNDLIFMGLNATDRSSEIEEFKSEFQQGEFFVCPVFFFDETLQKFYHEAQKPVAKISYPDFHDLRLEIAQVYGKKSLSPEQKGNRFDDHFPNLRNLSPIQKLESKLLKKEATFFLCPTRLGDSWSVTGRIQDPNQKDPIYFIGLSCRFSNDLR